MTSTPPLSPTFGAVNSASVLIDAPAERVWSVVLDRAAWMPTFVEKVGLDGATDSVGERALYRSRSEDGEIATRLEELLLLDAPARIVKRLALADDSATWAFCEWRIAATDVSSELEMNLYWLDVPEPASGWEEVQALRERYLSQTQAILEGYISNISELAVR